MKRESSLMNIENLQITKMRKQRGRKEQRLYKTIRKKFTK
jgi:hypothetical protein